MILVVFGSRSDEGIYSSLLSGLRDNGLKYDIFIASAHKSPNYVDRILEDANKKYRLVIAGAGLAAHLPGVIASKTIRPVIGIPVNMNFSGADSLLSIIQMPPYVPVLSVGIDGWMEAAKNSALILKKYDKISILNKKLIPKDRIEKMEDIFSKFDANFEYNTIFKEDCININPTGLDYEDSIRGNFLGVNVPVSMQSGVEDIKKLMQKTKTGLWVGLNRFENSAMAAIQLMNFDDEYSVALMDSKKKLEESFTNA